MTDEDERVSEHFGDGFSIVGHTCSKYFGPEWRAEQDDDKGIAFPRGLYGKNGRLECIMRGIVQGRGTREIARNHRVSFNTISKYRRVLEKLDLIEPKQPPAPKQPKRSYLHPKSFAKCSDSPRLRFLINVTYRNYLTDIRIEVINKFYADYKFNRIYGLWTASNNDLYRPTLSEKVMGRWDIDNLYFMTKFENKLKGNMSKDEWDKFKHDTNTQSDIFI